MSTSVILPVSPTMSTGSQSEHTPSSINTKTANTIRTKSHQEERKKLMEKLYKKSNKTDSKNHDDFDLPNKTIIIHRSSTSYAASESFIQDANSPLFNAIMDPSQFKNAPKCIPKLLKRASLPYAESKSNNDLNSQKIPQNKTKIPKKAKSYTTESLPDIPYARQKSKSLPCSPDLDHAAIHIHQTKDVIPPKKMKKQATNEELQLVLDHYEKAHEKDIEQILIENEPHVIEYRDKMFAQARKSGVTSKSDGMIRLKVLGNVVRYAYMNIEPPNEYTKQTDRKHFKEVGAWTAKFAKDKGIVPPVSLIYSAWCHDIERFIPATKCEYLPEAVDKYRKQVIHGVTSAKVATCLLKGGPVTQYEIDRIYELVLHHDIPNPREDIVILGEKLISGAEEDLMWELELLMDADSFAFFQSTIYYFILFKSKKNSPDWIWERVRNNVKRLRPWLRPKAAQCIHDLSQDVLCKMKVDYAELEHLCSDSGSNSVASTAPSSQVVSPDQSFINENDEKNQENDNHNYNSQNIKIVDIDVNKDELQQIEEEGDNINVSYLSADNLQKMNGTRIEMETSNSSNNSIVFESENCELVDINENKHI